RPVPAVRDLLAQFLVLADAPTGVRVRVLLAPGPQPLTESRPVHEPGQRAKVGAVQPVDDLITDQELQVLAVDSDAVCAQDEFAFGHSGFSGQAHAHPCGGLGGSLRGHGQWPSGLGVSSRARPASVAAAYTARPRASPSTARPPLIRARI